jgi:hypothetical protein
MHGRGGQDPWSFRNFAVYHRHHGLNRSNWIFINLPQALKNHIEEIFRLSKDKNTGQELWHLCFLKFCVGKWRKYINHLEGRLQKIMKAVSYVRLVSDGRADYHLDFSSAQKLGFLRRKLERSMIILRSYERLANTLLRTSTFLYEQREHDNNKRAYFEDSLKGQLSIAKGHRLKIQTLLTSCDAAASMLMHFLSLRNDGVLFENNKNLHNTIEISRQNTETIAWLSQQSSGDAHGTKITTMISMAYAPAALIAAIFSSDLIEIGSIGGNNIFTVRKEFWIFIVLVMALTMVTLGANWFLERQQGRRLRSSAPATPVGGQFRPAV